MMDYQEIINKVDWYIVNRTKSIILLFLAITILLSLGLGMTSTDTGTSQFTEGIDSQEALVEINENFERNSFGERQTGITQHIQNNQNVLSKESQIRMLEYLNLLSDKSDLKISSTQSVAGSSAREIDPKVDTIEDKINILEQSTEKEVRVATRDVLESGSIKDLVSEDYSSESVRASYTISITNHRFSGATSDNPQESSQELQNIQLDISESQSIQENDITVFGQGIVSADLQTVIVDSLLIVVPSASILIVLFLLFAYRDPVDMGVGILCLVMTIVWTFGFMGWAGIAFNQILITVPPLLLAIGIDFGIHSVNRYREEMVEGTNPKESMKITTDQLLLAFFIVTGTSVIGFWANISSALPPIQTLGLVAGIGIVFTFLIFGIFLPAMKLFVDDLKQNTIIPEFGNSPIGSGDSALGKTLSVGVLISRYIPIIFTVFILILSLFVANYAIGVGAGFSQEDFLPSEQQSGIANAFPEPFAPSEYESPKTLNLIDEEFEQDSDGGTVTVYIESPLRKGYTLEMIDSASQSPPDSFITNGRRAEQRSVLTLIQQYSQQDKEFRRLVERNDNNGNGIPDENLQTIYDELFSSQFGDQARSLITEDYRSTRIIYSVESSADNQKVTEDAQLVADRFTMSATATGSTVVFQDVGDLILQTALSSLIVAMSLSAVFLVLIYWYTERRPLLGLVNLVPVILTIVFVVATMRYLGVTFNALTATILSIGIGLGVDYSAHIVHRFSDEYDSNGLQDSIQTTIIGTGGALTGSMMTTASGIGVLVLAITPLLGQFGLIIATTIIYAYLFSIVMLPSVLVIWAKIDSFVRS